MSEMVERVAKAIFDCSGYDDDINFYLEDWAPAARAAIAAMREPTPEIIEVGRKKRFTGFAASTEEVWKAMIDEALK